MAVCQVYSKFARGKIMQNTNWTVDKILILLDLPLFELVYQAHTSHKQNFAPQEMEYCILSSIKTGACPEDCAYCPQSGHYNTNLKKEKLIDVNALILQAKNAKKMALKDFVWEQPGKILLLKISTKYLP